MTTNVPLPSTPDVDVQERRAWTMPGPIGLLGIVVAVGLIALGIQYISENCPSGTCPFHQHDGGSKLLFYDRDRKSVV